MIEMNYKLNDQQIAFEQPSCDEHFNWRYPIIWHLKVSD